MSTHIHGVSLIVLHNPSRSKIKRKAAAWFLLSVRRYSGLIYKRKRISHIAAVQAGLTHYSLTRRGSYSEETILDSENIEGAFIFKAYAKCCFFLVYCFSVVKADHWKIRTDNSHNKIKYFVELACCHATFPVAFIRQRR